MATSSLYFIECSKFQFIPKTHCWWVGVTANLPHNMNSSTLGRWNNYVTITRNSPLFLIYILPSHAACLLVVFYEGYLQIVLQVVFAAGIPKACIVSDSHSRWCVLPDVLSTLHTQLPLGDTSGIHLRHLYITLDVKECHFILKIIFQLLNMTLWMQWFGTILFSQRSHRMI